MLASDNQQVVLFTNGQTDDYCFAESILARMSPRKAILWERARDPRTLVTQMAQCRAVVAHRLHANIISYSLGIPSVGLVWDEKVAEFGKMTERSCFYLDSGDLDAVVVKQRLDEAMRAGVDISRLAEHKAAALKNIQSMLATTGMNARR